MRRITADQPHPLHDTAATRRLESTAAAQLPPGTLMQRAGTAVGRLALALAPHARTVWLACGPGNNGGDGLEAARHLRLAGRQVAVTWLGTPDAAPADARRAWERARQAGVVFTDGPPASLGPQDLCVDALLGIGLSAAARRGGTGARLQHLLAALHASPAPVLCVDLPSGLLADTGRFAEGWAPATPARHAPRRTLSLLTLHPGLFTAAGRDAAGEVWFDDLQVDAAAEAPCALLSAPPRPAGRAHDSHKGSYGDLAVVGGEGLPARGMGMTGAALLAASAALHAGAGRVMLSLLDGGLMTHDAQQPECMLRRFDALALEDLTVVCGCGGGLAVRPVLPAVLQHAARLVLDADALNAVAEEPALQALLHDRSARGQPTVLTPHPLEAARLLGCSTADIQADRLAAAHALAQRYQSTVVLKGSGSVVAAPGETPRINPTGNARLAAGGTGDVLAGLTGARLAAAPPGTQGAFDAAVHACWEHGHAADAWPEDRALTASALARALLPA
ncbi:NAD(P)H-hydrate dehydratase [Paracidovorax wautersii]|uniref:Bifunctional NAD(P)H-hydrate repair enzyme n=1 Tax=Paracidovorax wautersii TaxID=1177982 RepID=A0ABU1IFP4_9BURK|nr:NAD(P)H-hydrate dehydratase [Paracidovorax wautersii]MDR6216012.1 hydroxyethylthiazole kinase-like uncharacterized protein yjeF [Paracidovorax wautersii]